MDNLVFRLQFSS